MFTSFFYFIQNTYQPVIVILSVLSAPNVTPKLDNVSARTSTSAGPVLNVRTGSVTWLRVADDVIAIQQDPSLKYAMPTLANAIVILELKG